MKTVLVIEDSKEYQDLLQQQLKKEGYHVIAAIDGKDALEKIEKKAIDLILLDLLMPEEDGVTFYYKLQHVLKMHIPIIVLTNVTDAVGVGDDIKEVLIKANVSLADVMKKVEQYIS